MNAKDNPTATLVFDQECFLSNRELTELLLRALRMLDETGCRPVQTPEGVAMSNPSLLATLVPMSCDGAPGLRVTLASEDLSEPALHAKLAGLVVWLFNQLPAARVFWLEHASDLSRDAFLGALAPQDLATPRIAPRRVAPPASKAPRPDPDAHRAIRADLLPKGPCTARKDAHVQAYNAHLRATLLREADSAEIEIVLAERGPLPVEARLTTWAISLTAATVALPVAAPVMAYNLVRGEDMRLASLAMGLAGLFVALDTSGAMADVLRVF